MNSPRLVERDVNPRTAWTLEQAGVAPLLARLLAARGVREATELDEGLNQLLPPTGLKGLTERLAAAGGTLRAGPGAHTGFMVRAELPVETGAERVGPEG